METLPFIDDHSRSIDAAPEAVTAATAAVIERQMGRGAWFARLLRCDPVRASGVFRGEVGDAVPGFRVAEMVAGRRMTLRGRHRFSRYTLTFELEGDRLHAVTHAAFPGTLGRVYRALERIA